MNSGMKRVAYAAAAVMASACGTSVAQADTRSTTNGKFGFAAAFNLEYGGDEVARIYFEDDSDQSVRAGQGVTGLIGAHYRFPGNGLDITAMVGLKYVGTKASNANINITRTVLDLSANYWLNDDWWVGAGPVWHTGNEFHGSGIIGNLAFDDALGVTAKVGWRWVALTYTAIEYKDEFGFKYEADNVGVQFIGRF